MGTAGHRDGVVKVTRSHRCRLDFIVDPMYYAHPPSQEFLESKARPQFGVVFVRMRRISLGHPGNEDIVTIRRVTGVARQVRSSFTRREI